ncbi:hypothetical protein [Microbispora sp. CA-102843]|uniref:hypothetical protein n=1 Tax=Microbispora sp. CA-102843 TaxID=3239952 RepID=UPI003D8E4266
MRLPLCLAATALALAACTSSTTADTPASPAGPPADGGSYTSPRDIVAKMKTAGVDCPDYTIIAKPTNARELANCMDGNLVISIFETEGDVQANVDMHRETAKMIDGPVNMLTGRNWSVYYDDPAALQKAKTVLGGTLIAEPAAQ